MSSARVGMLNQEQQLLQDPGLDKLLQELLVLVIPSLQMNKRRYHF